MVIGLVRTRHDVTVDRLVAMYQGMGYKVRTEVPIGDRRVDVLAQNDEEILLIEVVDTHYPEGFEVNGRDLSQVVVEVKHPEKPRKVGCYVLKWVPCGKQCSGCPHGPYLYLVIKEGDKQHWIYKGRASSLPNLRDLVSGKSYQPNKPQEASA